jgi:hypothetical protein
VHFYARDDRAAVELVYVRVLAHPAKYSSRRGRGKAKAWGGGGAPRPVQSTGLRAGSGISTRSKPLSASM